MASDEYDALIRAARQRAYDLYEGVKTPHRSCGIALAETFGLPTAPYQALRKGGITGCGECGAIVAGRLILGQLLGDPDPTGPTTASLEAAMADYDAIWRARLDRRSAPGESIICNSLVGQFEEFMGDGRKGFCTNIAAMVAEAVAEVALRHGGTIQVSR